MVSGDLALGSVRGELNIPGYVYVVIRPVVIRISKNSYIVLICFFVIPEF